MKTSFTSLLFLSILALSPLSAQLALDQTTFITIGNGTTWVGNDGLALGAGDKPINTSVTHNTSVDGTTYSTRVTGGSSNNGNATVQLSTISPSFLANYTNSPTYTGRVWISFSADANSTDGWSNLKLLQNSTDNSGIVVGVGDVTGNHTWRVGYGPESSGTTTSGTPFSPTFALGSTRTDITNRSFILMQIDYNSGTNADVLSVWRGNMAFSLDAHGAPTNFVGLGSPMVTNTSDFNFDRLSIYAGGGSSFYLSDITLTSEIPEPSTYALMLGVATVAFVGIRRYRTHNR
jgi:hypothetical protein